MKRGRMAQEPRASGLRLARAKELTLQKEDREGIHTEVRLKAEIAPQSLNAEAPVRIERIKSKEQEQGFLQ